MHLKQSETWCRYRKWNYAVSVKRALNAVERRGDIGRRVVVLVLPISNRARMTSNCTGKIGLREPGEYARGPNLASRDNVAHIQSLYTLLETPPPATPLLQPANARRGKARGKDRSSPARDDPPCMLKICVHRDLVLPDFVTPSQKIWPPYEVPLAAQEAQNVQRIFAAMP